MCMKLQREHKKKKDPRAARLLTVFKSHQVGLFFFFNLKLNLFNLLKGDVRIARYILTL